MPVIAVDGPAASGKGTVAAGVARALGFHLLDSGALYRLVALQALRGGIGARRRRRRWRDSPPSSTPASPTAPSGSTARDVTAAIRTEEVGVAASRVAVHPAVRAALLGRQRAFRQPPGLVADGRDMGTVVFPDAPVKVFVTASAEERARRRHKQLIEKGISVTLESLLREIQERDARDSARAAAPLKAAADAAILDTTDLTIDAAIAFVLEPVQASVASSSGG